LNLTQNDVGKSLGATRITISGWENGRFLPIAENAYCYWTTLLDKSKLDGKSESWLIDEIFTQIPELYDAIPKMHDARRYQCVKAGMKCDWADDPDNSYLDHAVDSQLEIETLRAFEFAEKDLDLEIALRDDEDNEAEKSYLSGVI
jgi:DNA-binding XRE family transcriptional regulator